MLQYDKAIKVSSAPYVEQDIGSNPLIPYTSFNAATSFPNAPKGFGLKKGAGGSIVDAGTIVVSGWFYSSGAGYEAPYANSPLSYLKDMKTAGLELSDEINHSAVQVGLGSDTNANSNGIMTFVRAKMAAPPTLSSVGLTFDGRQYLDSSLAVQTSGARKGSDGNANVPGNAAGNPVYHGNLTVAEVNFLRSNFNISEFSNTNIIGDGKDWSEYVDNKDIDVGMVNVSLVGDYSGWKDNGGTVADSVGIGIDAPIYGVLDVDGKAPQVVINSAAHNGYLILHNVPHATRAANLGVVKMPDEAVQAARVDSTVGGNANTNNAMAVIYKNKAGRNNNMMASYQAYYDPISKAYKYTGARVINGGSFDNNYGSYLGDPAPFSLDPAKWEEKGKVGNVSEVQAAPGSVPGISQWDATAFNNLSATAAAPSRAPSAPMLAGAPLLLALEEKRKNGILARIAATIRGRGARRVFGG
jgi:hypothetical protein